ncbi:MAG: DnaD domain protein, partial [Psychrobacillus psychrodurans]
MESLEDWYKDFKNNFEILMEAIKICADRNKKSFGFFEYLLRDWANNNITSFEQVQSYERNKFGKPNKLQVVPSPEKKKDKPEYNYGF